MQQLVDRPLPGVDRARPMAERGAPWLATNASATNNPAAKSRRRTEAVARVVILGSRIRKAE
jgi:hypothetical protein